MTGKENVLVEYSESMLITINWGCIGGKEAVCHQALVYLLASHCRSSFPTNPRNTAQR